MVTAKLNVLDKNKRPIPCRGLLDTCSTTNFMTSAFADLLNLKRTTCNINIGAPNEMTTQSKEIATAVIQSRINNYQKSLTFLIVPNISQVVPDQPIDLKGINIPKNITLADPSFHQPAPVDLLLGAGTTLSLLSIGQLRIKFAENQELFLQKTLLGWILGGTAPTMSHINNNKQTCNVMTTVEFELSKFWELEECPTENKWSNEEKYCEEHFKETIKRNAEGRYVVSLPFNQHIDKLRDSYEIAKRRLESTERRLDKNPILKSLYRDVINEYKELNHMSLIKENSMNNRSGYYLPHHAVIKESSLTTKLRVVFDGSAKTTSGVSLNDTLYVGPVIQSDLFSLLIRFRKHPIVLTGDIEKMYRQFLVRKEDRKFQRILWRDDNNQINTYELNTITFGLSSAPYLAIRCLQQLADDEGKEFPQTAKIIKEDFYVDDLLTGANTKEEVIKLRKELTTILAKANLSIRQWASNDNNVLDHIPKEQIHLKLQLDDASTIKTLGIHWNATTDAITYTVNVKTQSAKITKSHILSEVAKIFDPLGLLAPIIIIAKIILQKLWALKLHWDESLPSNIYSEWNNYYRQLSLLNNISFNRTIITPSVKSIQLHGFSDASERAYGACVYLRTIDAQNQINVLLLCSKSRVTPLKTQTIPRLELCGAQLLTKLMKSVTTAMKLPFDELFYWTDSTIVLHWLNTSPHLLKTFISNRVAEIQAQTKSNEWHHISTKDNPADLVSRGQTAHEFLLSDLWKYGPTWLSESRESWPLIETEPLSEIPEKRQSTCLHSKKSIEFDIFKRFSNIDKLTRTLSYCLRFIKRSKQRGPLTVKELQDTLTIVIKVIQQQNFANELRTINKNLPIKPNNSIIKLNPFIDKDGVMRVGGRLSFSDLPFDAKHPIILPKNNHITKLLIEREHKLNLHTGVQQTLYLMRQRYWPIDGKSQIWKVIKNCVICCKTNPPSTPYLMGNLPKPRITPSLPFNQVGIDYCGPFILKEKKFRNKIGIKAYVAVFVCLSSKAIHLELVTDLSTDGFISTLRRFIARRGMCQDIYSDNGRNFVGANNVLKEVHEMLNKTEEREKIQGFLTTKLIQWHFIPPQAPHVGGLWEAAVKSFKKHLKHVANRDMLFTYEQFNTLIIEIEAILNSRPLTPISTDPNDPIVLTPGHLLIGKSLTSLRGKDESTTSINLLSTWQHIQRVKQHFWIRWKNEYLNELTIRNKWNKIEPNITTNSIVLLRDDNSPPTQWAMGRIIECHPGNDGVVRTVTVKTATSVLQRNVKKLVILPIPSDDSEKEKNIHNT